MRLLPDFAPVWCSRSSGTPSNMPPTTPSFAWNSSMMRALKSAGDVDIVLLEIGRTGRAAGCSLSDRPAMRHDGPTLQRVAVWPVVVSMWQHACCGDPFAVGDEV